MSPYEPSNIWGIYAHRFMAEGVQYRDMLDLQSRIKTSEDWSSAWAESAASAEARAATAVSSGFQHTAGGDLSRASLYYFFAQFLDWHNPERKREMHMRCVDAFRRAGAYLDPPQERVEIPFRGTTMPGYLRLPHSIRKPPLVVLLGGLDTTKEEQLVISTLCVQRGMATLSFDGPGQGETFYSIKMSAGMEDALAAVFDFAESLAEINSSRMGIIGRSMGGYYGPRIAALDKRVKAVVAWGAMFSLDASSLPLITMDGMVYVTGSKDATEARRYIATVNLEDVADKITCPLLIVHGGLDKITPTDNAIKMKERAKGPVEMLVWDDSVHCAHDRAHICRPAMADFMMKSLRT